MKSKIILNLAMSIDGYIASETGGYDWIVGDGNNALNTEKKIDSKDFLEEYTFDNGIAIFKYIKRG